MHSCVWTNDHILLFCFLVLMNSCSYWWILYIIIQAFWIEKSAQHLSSNTIVFLKLSLLTRLFLRKVFRSFFHWHRSGVLIVHISLVFSGNFEYLWCFARFDTICSIQKTWKHPWRDFSKSNTTSWVFFTFLNCTNVTKSRKTSHLLRLSTKNYIGPSQTSTKELFFVKTFANKSYITDVWEGPQRA